MSPFLVRAALALLVSVVVLPVPALAGSNVGGTVFLSWDRAGTDSVLHATPIAPFALFLHLRQAPEVRALAVKLTWTTNATDRPPCYAVSSAGYDGGRTQCGNAQRCATEADEATETSAPAGECGLTVGTVVRARLPASLAKRAGGAQ